MGALRSIGSAASIHTRPDRRRWPALLMALPLVATACGGDDAGNVATQPLAQTADPGPDDPDLSPEVPGNGEPEPDDPVGAPEAARGGVELLGWVEAPYERSGFDDHSPGMAAGTRLIALRFRLCGWEIDGVARPNPNVLTVADADGVPLLEPLQQISQPLVSPELLRTAPEPGECVEGWVQPVVPADATPQTALLSDVMGDEPIVWELGDPLDPLDLPVDGDTLAPGESWSVGSDARWIVDAVLIPDADDELAPTADAPDGSAWVVIDARYCAGSDPGSIVETLGLTVDGWVVRGRPRTVESAVAPTDEDCERRPQAIALPANGTVTSVTGTDGGGPWWLIPPLELG